MFDLFNKLGKMFIQSGRTIKSRIVREFDADGRVRKETVETDNTEHDQDKQTKSCAASPTPADLDTAKVDEFFKTVDDAFKSVDNAFKKLWEH